MKKKLFLLGCGPGFDVMSSGHAATTTDSCHLQISGNNTAPATQFAAVTASPRDLVNSTSSTETIDYTHYSSSSSSTPPADNTHLSANGTADPLLAANYPVDGQISAGGDSAAIPQGTYADVINVAVND